MVQRLAKPQAEMLLVVFKLFVPGGQERHANRGYTVIHLPGLGHSGCSYTFMLEDVPYFSVNN